MTRLRFLLLPMVLGSLVACGPHPCGELPYCVNTTPVETQPNGRVVGGVSVPAGQRAEATFTFFRAGLPANDPLSFVPLVVTGAPAEGLLARSAAGIEVFGASGPFTQDSVAVTVVVPASLAPGEYAVDLQLRRSASQYPNTVGAGVVSVHVQ